MRLWIYAIGHMRGTPEGHLCEDFCDRARKLVSKIDEAIERVEDGSYGYCVETGEPISLRRLEARPIATLSVEAQERHERLERTRRDD